MHFAVDHTAFYKIGYLVRKVLIDLQKFILHFYSVLLFFPAPVPMHLQEEFIDLKNDPTMKTAFENSELTTFLCNASAYCLPSSGQIHNGRATSIWVISFLAKNKQAQPSYYAVVNVIVLFNLLIVL